MRTITLADGQTFDILMCGESRSDVLWIESAQAGLEFREVLDLFDDSEKTKRISETDAFGVEHVYEDYTELVHIQRQPNGTVLFALKRVVIM